MARSFVARRSLSFAAPVLFAFAAFDTAAATPPPTPRTPPAAPVNAAADIDAVRGCWIQKVEPDGRATLLLRLLPDRERSDWLIGQLQRADGDDPDKRLRLMFSRDGQHAAMATAPIVSAPTTAHADSPIKTLRSAKARKPNADAMPSLIANPTGQVEYVRSATTAWPAKNAAAGTRVIEYLERGGGKRLRVEVSAEQLKLSVSAAGLRPHNAKAAQAVLFDGGRDGCD
jgi:hypothetical protein